MLCNVRTLWPLISDSVVFFGGYQWLNPETQMYAHMLIPELGSWLVSVWILRGEASVCVDALLYDL